METLIWVRKNATTAFTNTSDRAAPRHRARSAITRPLQAHYSSARDERLPSELKTLVAQCLAIEARKHGSTEQAVEALQLAIVRPASPAKTNGME